MQLAIVVALSPDRQQGQAVTGVISAVDAVQFVKRAIQNVAKDGPPVAGHPHLLAVCVGGVGASLRQHRFSAAEMATAEPETATAEPATAETETVSDSESTSAKPAKSGKGRAKDSDSGLSGE